MDKHILTQNRVFQCQTCSLGTWDEALEWVRINNLAGTANNWQKHDGEDFKPVTCQKYPERTHYMFTC